jgi:hypothetical protein
MTLRIIVVTAILALCSGCTIQTPLAEHDIELIGANPAAQPGQPDQAAGEERELGNPVAVPQL